MQIARAHVVLVVVVGLFTVAAPATRAAAARRATLRVGEGVSFATGKVTRAEAEVDLGFRYLPPQGPHGWRYNPATRQIEYQAQVAMNQHVPLLVAARIGSFATAPDLSKLTAGDLDTWTGDEVDIGPGRWLLVRGKIDGAHHLVRILELSASSNDPRSWKITFTHEPVTLGLGVAGSAGKRLPLRGTLAYRERLASQKIIELDLASGKVATRFDGSGVSRDRSGAFAYVDAASRIVLADAAGKELAVLEPPPFSPSSFGVGGAQEVVISADGERLAVVGERSRAETSGGITVQGVPTPTVVVIDRRGRELASFHATRAPAWTPDGRLLVAGVLQSGLFVSDRALRALQPIAGIPEMENLSDPAVSPDGRTIAFSGNGRVWLVGLDGAGLRQLNRAATDGEITPTWSPDGAFIALQQLDLARGTNSHHILVVRVADGQTVIVTDERGATREPAGRMAWR